jgi:type IV pilus assembly protein PilE
MHSHATLSRARGFTLIELMVVVVIVTILLAIAVPSYMQQIRQSRRTEAKTALLDLAGREERYLTTNPSGYTITPANLGYSAFGIPIADGYYEINPAQSCIAGNGAALACDGNLNAPTGPSYYFVVTPIAGTSQAADTQCTSFAVDSIGNQYSTGTYTSSQCWSQ